MVEKVAGSSGKELPPQKVQILQRLRIWEKIKKGELERISKDNVEELIKALDTEDKGELTKQDLACLRQVPGCVLSEENLLAVALDADKDNSGKICTEELFKALTQGELAFNLVKESLGRQTKVVDDRAIALKSVTDWIRHEDDTSQALWSLPLTMFLFLLFMVLMSKHLNLNTAYHMQTGLANEIEGEGPPYLHDHEWAIVHDVDTLWQWMSSSFISLHFKEDLTNWPYPGRVAAYNQIIGGVELKKTDITEPKPCAQSIDLNTFYDTRGGLCHRSENPDDSVHKSEFVLYHERNEDILRRIQNLSDTFWISQNTSFLDVHTLYYNAHLAAFTDCHLTFAFLESGLVKIRLNQETFQADPYFDRRWIVLDLTFILIILNMFFKESYQVISASKNGVDGLISYMDLWNLVDWLSIIVGAVVMGYWGSIFWQVTGELQDIISGLPTEKLDRYVLQNNTFLTLGQIDLIQSRASITEQIRALHIVTKSLNERHKFLRELVFMYSFVLMMKFFKAFNANPRLDIVIRTMTKSAVEIIHFLLVFGVIFLCFSSAGYVVFGSRVMGFRGQVEAMFMCWRILMGEFDIEDMQMSSPMYTIVWMVSFQFLVLLILLNMLLAIIMETYQAAKTEKGDSADAVTIWTQIKEACFTLRETQGHMPLYQVLLPLQDPDYPAHPLPIVTSKSLRRAFPKMTKHQSDYILKKTVKFINDEQEELDISMSDALRILSHLKVNTRRTVEDTSQILHIITEDKRIQQQSRFNAVWGEPDAPMVADRPMQGTGRPMQDMALTPSSLGGTTATGVPMSLPSPSIASGSIVMPPLAGSGEILAQLARLQDGFQQQQQHMLETITTKLQDYKDYCQERDTWMDQKMTGIEKRCKQVLDGSDKLLACLQGVDFTDIPSMLSRMERLLPGRGAKDVKRNHTGLDDDDSDPSQAVDSAQMAAQAKASHCAMVQKLDTLGDQMKRVLEQADEAAEGRKVLWKIDLGIRQLRQGVPLPQPPQQQQPQMQQPCEPCHRERAGSRSGNYNSSQSSSQTQATVSSQRRVQQETRHLSAPPGTPPRPSSSTGESPSFWWADRMPGGSRVPGSRESRQSSLLGGSPALRRPNTPVVQGGSPTSGPERRIFVTPEHPAPRPSDISQSRT